MTNKLYINSAQLKALSDKQAVLIVDVREPDEFAREAIPGAKNIPLSQFDAAATLPKDQIVVFHCRSGNRTRQAQGQFEALGIKQMYILEAGIQEWKQSGGKTQVNKKAPFPIMRQVQIIVGLMVLLGVVLAHFVSPYFLWLSAFFGAGLLFAGLSGTCALANLLLLLPFNKSKK